MRLSRRWLAALMILSFASAQFIGLARACVSGLEALEGAHGQAASRAAVSMPADCPAMTVDGPPSSTACEAQCLPREQADRAAEARVALAPPSVFVVRTVARAVPGAVRATPPRATIASPPLALLYSRFLH